jgi:lipopolysaccharide export system protein LptC
MKPTHKRTAHRGRLAAIMTLGLAFALGSFWLVQVINRGDIGNQGEGLLNEPDYIVEKFSFVRMTPAGKPRYIVSGDKLTHRPVDDISDVERPVVQNMAPAQQAMTMNAQRGRIDHTKNVVDLEDKVHIERAGSAAVKPLTIRTEQLRVFPDEERMTSDQLVTMTVGATSIRGVGMRADNAAQTVRFSKNSQIVYPARARQAPAKNTGQEQ